MLSKVTAIAEAHATRAKRQKLPFLLVVAHLVVAVSVEQRPEKANLIAQICS